MIIYGTYFGGKIKEAHGEWIESKYVLLMVPLVPYKSLFVTGKTMNGRSGFELPVNGISVVHGYLRFFSFILAIVCWGASIFGERGIFGLPFYVIGGIFGLLYCWSRFQVAQSTGSELVERTILKNVVGSSALPEWLPISVRAEMKENLQEAYNHRFAGKDFGQLRQARDLSGSDSIYLYTYLRYFLDTFDRAKRVQVEQWLADIRDNLATKVDFNNDADLNDLRKESETDMSDDIGEQ